MDQDDNMCDHAMIIWQSCSQARLEHWLTCRSSMVRFESYRHWDHVLFVAVINSWNHRLQST